MSTLRGEAHAHAKVSPSAFLLQSICILRAWQGLVIREISSRAMSCYNNIELRSDTIKRSTQVLPCG
jgi:hypothetical protein